MPALRASMPAALHLIGLVGAWQMPAGRAIPAKVDECEADARGGLDLDYVFEGNAAAEAGGATRAVCGGA